MSAVQMINPNADVIDGKASLLMNTQAAIGLQDVLKSNLGPKGTLKMYVSSLFPFVCVFTVFALPDLCLRTFPNNDRIFTFGFPPPPPPYVQARQRCR